MLTQSALGLWLHDRYRDAAWISATWFGNDWTTLVIASPLLLIALVHATQGSPSGTVLWLGLLAYGVYNYAYYIFGAALNIFFPLYLAAALACAFTLISAARRLEPGRVTPPTRRVIPARIIGGCFVCLGTALTAVWLTLWAAYVFTGRPTPLDSEAFKLIAALDILLMAPALVIGGTLLMSGHAWGYVIAGAAGVQASLYLFVLLVNSIVFICRGITQAPGELPIWGTLAALTATLTLLLIARTGDAQEV